MRRLSRAPMSRIVATSLFAVLLPVLALAGSGAAAPARDRAAGQPLQRVVPRAAAASGPVNTASPVVSGKPQVGQTLTTSTGTWTSSTPIAYSYQWRRCNAVGSDCPTTIAGATGKTYVLTAADAGHSLRSVVVAKNASGSGSAVSAPTAVVAASDSPANSAAPVVSGTAQEGQTLTTSDGKWSSPTPLTFSYQWRRCDALGGNCPTTIAGATGKTYILKAADVDHSLRSVVIAKNDSGSGSALSAPTPAVTALSDPVVVAAPIVSGTIQEGQALTTSNGSWTSTTPIAYSYQWRRCNTLGSDCPTTIAGATGKTYILTAADVGHSLRSVVVAKNASGSSSAVSSPTGVVSAIAPAAPGGAIRLPNGKISIPAGSVSKPQRLVVDQIQFFPRRIRSQQEPLTARFHVSDTRGDVIRGALVYAVGVPFDRLSAEPEARTGTDGWVTIGFRVLPTFSLRSGNLVVIFVRARKPGDNLLAGVSTRRLVAVRVG